ncbi:Uncharacterised protein [Serratia fonticola]|nr:Uncharacterised protein [Serratia fonticola]
MPMLQALVALPLMATVRMLAAKTLPLWGYIPPQLKLLTLRWVISQKLAAAVVPH